MAEIEIGDLGTVGLIKDQEGNYIAPEALTAAMNMRSVADGVERLGGQASIFGTPPAAPHFAMAVQSATSVFWLWTTLTKGYVWDGSNHTEITRLAGPYTATETRQWNGTLLGGVPILNNGADVPQYWASLNPAVKLFALPAWPATWRAAVIRSFGPYLIALNTLEAGVLFPHTLIWSHPADPGTVPASWDYTDPTVDAGRTALPDVGAGVIVDGLPLRGNFYIYKEGSTWRMTNIGGQFIFKFDTFLESSGALGPRCVTLTGDGSQHVVATQDDIIVHNGNTAQSILTNRMKRYLANNIDTNNFRNSFIFANPFRDEIVFCYPEPGFLQPNRALIWNYKNGPQGVLTEADVNYSYAALGQIESASAETWDGGSTLWDQYDGSWSQISRRRVVLCSGVDPSASPARPAKFYSFDDSTTTTYDGVPYIGMTQRENLSLVGRKRTGEWIVDFEKRKMMRRLWIRATGGPITVRVGFTEQMNGSTSWTNPQSFTPTTQQYIDVFGSGRAVSVEFSSTVPYKLLSYKLEGELIGEGM